MGQAKVVVRVVQGQLLTQALLVFTQRDDAPTDRRHMLPNREVHALNEGRVDPPTVRWQHLVNRLKGAKHDTVGDPHQMSVSGSDSFSSFL
jgi:hypothetical protein